ncbi:hypothetical protein TraAM80_07970 [Trypanosoma rangeli]|uniref:Uncharacterized protein n=1 Tax=Trypanosoma rangeli TaxID=5698 RepID=A0A3R7NB15_TRYRA|nr:uncharacterized protein TraAM80_07970 [Trypanosoma rangeli]RNE99782.1 hypothetical protein TraAM80_07970 [Trypanosoma rangeli]|eukprot:RNE99782.1 hypothetical protein TraAM80_07970 [Trypanosoma rangeli]
MRSRRWGTASLGERGSLTSLNFGPQAGDMTTRPVWGRGTPTTGTVATCLTSLSLAEVAPGETSTTTVALRCVERVRESLGLVRRYMAMWRRWVQQRHVLVALQRIRLRAVTSHLLSTFYKWFFFASCAAAVRHLKNTIVRDAAVSLVHRYWQRWRMEVRLRRKQSKQLACLRSIRYEAERTLARRYCVRWRSTVKRRVELRRRLAAVSESRTIRLAYCYFTTWVRWRQRNWHTTQLRHIAHAAYRSLARRTLQKWSLLVSRHIVVWDEERRTLEAFVRVFSCVGGDTLTFVRHSVVLGTRLTGVWRVGRFESGSCGLFALSLRCSLKRVT